MAYDDRLLGRGIYDVGEIAFLVRRSPSEISTWASPTKAGDDALLLPRERRLFTFWDLVTAAVTARLLRREVKLARVRYARNYLREEFGVDWPLAHAASLHRLASVGPSVYLQKPDGWVDASEGGQLPFAEVVEPLIHRLDFSVDGMASAWRPVDGVVINPRVQAGTPCVEGTRVATHLLAQLVDAGEDVGDIADDYDLDPALVAEALAFERNLAA